MPPAHFLVFSPFIHLSLPRSRQICPMPTVTTVLPTSSPVTKTAPICLFSRRFFALRPFVQRHDILSSLLSACIFFPSPLKEDLKKKKKRRRIRSPPTTVLSSVKPQQMHRPSSAVCLSLSALFVLWQDYLIVYRV